MIEQFYDLSRPLLDADERALALCREQFARLEEIKEYNQLKMLKAFTDCRVGGSHLVGTTGYGMDDAGRGKLEEVFAVLTGSEAALFRHNFMSGTHTLSVALFGVLRPGDRMVAVTGRPYDTLAGVIGIDGTHYGNLMEFGVQYDEVDLLADGTPDFAGIARKCRGAKMCYIQRSRGYAARPALSLEQIEAVSRAAKAVQPDIIVMVDNCYGEFTQKQEPTQRGADLMAGSLIKNPGGGIAPTGGYIAGRADLVELCTHRLSAPGVGGEIGCTLDMLRGMYLGLYYAPGVVCEALKPACMQPACSSFLVMRPPRLTTRSETTLSPVCRREARRVWWRCAAACRRAALWTALQRPNRGTCPVTRIPSSWRRAHLPWAAASSFPPTARCARRIPCICRAA